LITLPEANGEPAEETAQTLELLVNAEGNYAVTGQNLINREIKTIMAALQDASGGNVELPLIITADAQASHQAVVIAMDAAGQLGFSRLNIATQQTQEQ
jgi:biopolymer transport protein ExbD